MTTARLRAPRRAPAQPTSGLQASAACTCTQRKLAQSTPCTRTAVSGRTSSQGGALQPRSGTSQRAGGARTALPRLQAAQQQRRHALGQQGVQPLLRLRVERRRARRVERVQRAVDAAQRHLPGVHGLARAACGSAARSLQGSGLGLPARLPHAALQRRQAGAAPRLGCGGAHRSRACPAPWRGPGGRPRQRCRRPSGMRHAGPCRHRSACRTGTPCCAGAAADQVHIFRCCLQALPDGDMQQCAPARTARARCRTVQRPQPLTQSCGAAGWLERWSATGAAS